MRPWIRCSVVIPAQPASDAENVSGDGIVSVTGSSGISGDQSGSDTNGGQSGTTDGKSDSGSSSDRSPELQQALNDAAQAMKDSQSAMKNGDWTAYGKAQKELEDALNKAIELDGSFQQELAPSG